MGNHAEMLYAKHKILYFNSSVSGIDRGNLSYSAGIFTVHFGRIFIQALYGLRKLENENRYW